MATATSGESSIMKWVDITVVPLGVFLIGACLLGCLTRFWRNLGLVGANSQTDEVPADGPNIPIHRNAQDLESGLPSPQVGTRAADDAGSAFSLNFPGDA